MTNKGLNAKILLQIILYSIGNVNMKKCNIHVAAVIAAFLIVTSMAAPASAAMSNQIITDGVIYNQVTDDSSLTENFIDKTTHMTFSQLGKKYEEYCVEQGLPDLDAQLNENVAPDTIKVQINNFAQHEVDKGVIPNTAEAKANVAISAARSAIWNLADQLKSRDPMAVAFLQHSLQDNPSNLYYAPSTAFAGEVKGSRECRNLVTNYVNYVNYVKRMHFSKYSSGNQSTILNSTEDLHLALNQVNFVESGSKNSVGNWNLFITFSDTYDFDPSWGSEDPATIMNNIAAYAQQGGVIVPYRVQIKIGTSFVG